VKNADRSQKYRDNQKASNVHYDDEESSKKRARKSEKMIELHPSTRGEITCTHLGDELFTLRLFTTDNISYYTCIPTTPLYYTKGIA
jgi:hypothetical protein